MWNNWIETHEFRGITSYELAFARWQKAPNWRGETGDFTERKLKPNKSTRVYSIRMLADGAIACKYHNTDVVTFNVDKTIKLIPWASNTTSMFANALLPRGVFADFNNRHGVMLHLDDRWYKLDGSAPTIRKDDEGQWQFVGEHDSEPFEVPRVNREKARAALKARDFTRFRQWIKAACVMCPDHDFEHRGTTDRRELLDIYEARARWPELLTYRGYYPDADDLRMCFGRSIRTGYFDHASGHYVSDPLLTPIQRATRQARRITEAMRLAIYETDRCVEIDTHPYVTGWDQLEAIESATRKMPWTRWS